FEKDGPRQRRTSFELHPSSAALNGGRPWNNRCGASMSRLVIHAGFPKTGSSSIQSGIGWHIDALNARNIFMFGKEMTIGREGRHPGLPIWFIEDAAKNGRSLAQLIANGIAEACPDATLVLTSENLDQVRMPPLFVGLPDDLDVS